MKTSLLPNANNPDISGVLTAQRSSNFSSAISADAIDRVARTRLSPNFILRDFLFCSSSAARGFSNFPENPEQVIQAGQALCEKLLEPILGDLKSEVQHLPELKHP